MVENRMDRILCLGPTPAAQRVMVFPKLTRNAVNRTAMALDTAAGKSVNVAKVLKALGGHPVALGFLGGGRGDFVRSQLAGRNIQMDFLPVTANTRECLTILDESDGACTELVEESHPVSAADYEKLEARVRQYLVQCRAIVLSGSLTPDGPRDFYSRCVSLARAQRVISVVDASGTPLAEALRAGPGLVKPNRSELAATVGRRLEDETAVLSAMRELQERGAQRVVVTAGAGAVLAWDGRNAWKITVPTIHPRNPIGSGDAFTAGMVWRLLRGEDLGEACRWGAAVGAANALSLLPGEIDFAEVGALVRGTSLARLE